jgi:hypothetical protein
MRKTAKTPRSKAHVKLPDLKPKKQPKGGMSRPDPPTGFNDNLTLLR